MAEDQKPRCLPFEESQDQGPCHDGCLPRGVWMDIFRENDQTQMGEAKPSGWCWEETRWAPGGASSKLFSSSGRRTRQIKA